MEFDIRRQGDPFPLGAVVCLRRRGGGDRRNRRTDTGRRFARRGRGGRQIRGLQGSLMRGGASARRAEPASLRRVPVEGGEKRRWPPPLGRAWHSVVAHQGWSTQVLERRDRPALPVPRSRRVPRSPASSSRSSRRLISARGRCSPWSRRISRSRARWSSPYLAPGPDCPTDGRSPWPM